MSVLQLLTVKISGSKSGFVILNEKGMGVCCFLVSEGSSDWLTKIHTLLVTNPLADRDLGGGPNATVTPTNTNSAGKQASEVCHPE